MLNKVIAFFTALITCIGGFFTSVSDKIFYPPYEMTESIAFAQSLGRGWNLGNNLDACQMHSAEKFGFSCIVWDDGYVFTIIDRNNLKVLYPEYLQAVV